MINKWPSLEATLRAAAWGDHNRSVLAAEMAAQSDNPEHPLTVRLTRWGFDILAVDSDDNAVARGALVNAMIAGYALAVEATKKEAVAVARRGLNRTRPSRVQKRGRW